MSYASAVWVTRQDRELSQHSWFSVLYPLAARPASRCWAVISETITQVTTMGSAPYEQDYWLAHADKAYARAEDMDDPNARLTMLSVAKGYECLAQHEQERAELLAAIEKRH
jgi:hypothetical protein